MQTVTYRMDKQQVLLYSTESCIQYPGINHHGKEYRKEYIYVYVCVCVCPWRRNWQLTPVFLPGKAHGTWWAVAHGGYKNWT